MSSRASYLLRLLLGLIVGGISFLYFYYKSQAIYSGLLYINHPSLSSPIKIHYDEHGFTHIRAKTNKDAFFAIGVAHAKDRLWQMQFLRRLSSGTLSEVLGEKAGELDKMARTIGFRRVAENDVGMNSKDRDHSEINNLISKYVEGVNWWANTHYLPPEFYLIGDRFANWTMVDSFSYVRLMCFSMMVDHPNELLNRLIRDKLGEKYYNLLYTSTLFDYPFFNETILSVEEIEALNGQGKNNKPDNGHYNSINDYFTSALSPPNINVKASSIRETPMTFEKNHEHASNSWTISGEYTNTSKPIYSHDPHLGNSIPGYHYIVKLYLGEKGDDIKVGSAIPCIPFIIIGNNMNHAYGTTTDNRDISDGVEEKLDNDNITLAKYYYVDGVKHKLKVNMEMIKIKGKEDYYLEVKETRNGPVIEKGIKEFGNVNLDYTFESENKEISNALSGSMSPFKQAGNLQFHYNMMFGKSKDDFLPALDSYVGPSFALTWANINGEIGYVPIGAFVIKDNPQQVFGKGYSSEYKSTYPKIKLTDTPVYLNPSKGYITTANNYPFPSNYKFFSTHYSYHYRFHRINQLIRSKIKDHKFTIDDSIDIGSDVKDLACELMLREILPVLEKHKATIDPGHYNSLKGFDCEFTKDSKVGTGYEIFEYKLIQYGLVKNPATGVNEGFKNPVDTNGLFTIHTMFFLLYNIVKNKPKLENCSYFIKGHNCEEYIVDVYNNLDRFLSEYKLFSNTKTKDVKKWGDVHYHYYTHPFEKSNLMKRIFTRKAYTDGTRNTVKVSKNKMTFENPFTSVHSANGKFISDGDDITRPYICLDTGNSGNIFSKFYDNGMTNCEKNGGIKIENYDFEKDDSQNILISNYKGK